jgi:hypothetical protein
MAAGPGVRTPDGVANISQNRKAPVTEHCHFRERDFWPEITPGYPRIRKLPGT